MKRGKNMSKFHLMAGACVAILGVVPAAAHAAAAAAAADNSVTEVVVTATKTGSTNLQKTPLAISVVGGDVLKESRVVSLKDLSTVVSSVKIGPDSANVIVRIRGIGGSTAIGDGDVSVYMDGVYLSRMSVVAQSNFNDLDRIEVVKGPQGTLFGRNAVGGALNFITKRPTHSFTFDNTLSVGNYNLIDEAFVVGGPISPTMQASLAFGYVKRDGYLTNIIPNMPNLGAANRRNARVQLQWEPTDQITNILRADYIYTNEIWSTTEKLLVRTDDPRVAASARFPAPIANSIVGDLTKVASDLTPYALEQAYGINDEFKYKINDNLTVSNLIAYRTDKSRTLHVANDATEYYLADASSLYREHQFSDELNLQHTFGPLTGVVGLYYYKEYERQYYDAYSGGRNPGRKGAGNRTIQDTQQPTTSKGIFASETYHVTPTVSVTVGGRYSQEIKGFSGINTQTVFDPGAANNGTLPPSTVGVDYPFIRGYGSPFPVLSKSQNAFTPKVGVDWQINDDSMVYASVARGFRSGGYSNSARKDTASGTLTPQFTVPVRADFEPEWITTYEIGSKTELFDRRLRLNISVFRNDWTNLQVTSTVAPLVNITNNAAAARVTGFDIDALAKPLDGLTLTASATFLPKAQYTEYKNANPPAGILLENLTASGDPRLKPANLNPLGTATYNASGKRLISAPKATVILSAQKDFDLSDGGQVYARTEYQYTSVTDFDVTNDPLVQRPAYSLFNGQIGYRHPGGKWRVQIWGRNLANKQYVNDIIPRSQITATVGPPRTFGVLLDYSF
jgi:iron complex outermembrane receptor protein